MNKMKFLQLLAIGLSVIIAINFAFYLFRDVDTLSLLKVGLPVFIIVGLLVSYFIIKIVLRKNNDGS